MIQRIATVLVFLSALFFPWPLTAILALGVSLYEPLVPLAAGIFADALYYAPFSGTLPVFSFAGMIASGIAFLVRSRLKASIIGE